MDNVITQNVVLRFDSDTSERIQITIPRARLDITEPQARAAMDGMIDGGIILTDNGRPYSIRSAEFVTTTRRPIE